jgi:hypothetical protein
MSKTVGTFEAVQFPEFGSAVVKAKIDTGAYTGAMHCADIREEVVDGGMVLHFVPLDCDKEIKQDDFLIKYVRSSNGKRQKRYFINTKITIQGDVYDITLSLTSRSEMRYPVLIGRRFLRNNAFLVDPGKAYVYREQTGTK